MKGYVSNTSAKTELAMQNSALSVVSRARIPSGKEQDPNPVILTARTSCAQTARSLVFGKLIFNKLARKGIARMRARLHVVPFFQLGLAKCRNAHRMGTNCIVAPRYRMCHWHRHYRILRKSCTRPPCHDPRQACCTITKSCGIELE
jgi:hypothetical protein